MIQIICQECKKQTPADQIYCIHCNKVPLSLPKKEIQSDVAEGIQSLKIQIYAGLAVSILAAMFGFLSILKGHIDFLPSAVFFGVGLYGVSHFYEKYTKANNTKCPKCNRWDSYFIQSDEVLDSWQRWETRTFTDNTRNPKGEIISTTTRQQQVLVTYQDVKYDCGCNSCDYTYTYTKVKSWVN
jgi:hypothetical protein